MQPRKNGKFMIIKGDNQHRNIYFSKIFAIIPRRFILKNMFIGDFLSNMFRFNDCLGSYLLFIVANSYNETINEQTNKL